MKPKILDRFENEIGILPDCIEGIAIEERNGMCEAEITYPIFSLNWNELKRGNIVVVDINDTLKNQKCRIYKVSKPINGKIKIYARHIFFDLARDIIEKFSLVNASCEYALNELFRRSQFSQGFTGYSDIINAQDYKMSTINLIKAIGGTQGSILDTYGTGAEILRDNKKVYIKNRRGHDNGVSIEYSKNMTGLNIEFDDSSLITRIKAIAKYTDDNNNEVIVNSNPKYVDSPLINNYETPFITEIDFSGEFDNDEIPTGIKLTELAEKYFRDNKCDQIKTNIKVEFIPLSKCVGYFDIQDKISLCDTVTIKDYRYNLDTQAKVIKTYYNFLTDRYEKMELGDPKVTLGDLVGGGNSGPGAGGEESAKVPGINDSSFPDTLPAIPVLNSKLYGFDTIELSWTFEAKTYYTYELYASKVKDFSPNTFDLLFKGNASTFLHSAKPSEIWYYKIRAVNTHGKATAFSNQVAVETVKIENLENYVANAAIGDALIGELNLGRGWFGQLRGNYIDAKHLTVTDGNGKRTLDIDSFGNVTLLPTNFKMLVDGKEEEAVTQSSLNVAMDNVTIKISENLNEGKNISNSNFRFDKNGLEVSSNGTNTKAQMKSEGFKIIRTSDGAVLFEARDGRLYIDGHIASDYTIQARGGIYTGQAVRGTKEDGTAFVTTHGSVVLRTDAPGQHAHLQTNTGEGRCTTVNALDWQHFRAKNLLAMGKVYENGKPIARYLLDKDRINDIADSVYGANVYPDNQSGLWTDFYRIKAFHPNVTNEENLNLGTQISALVLCAKQQKEEIENLKNLINELKTMLNV